MPIVCVGENLNWLYASDCSSVVLKGTGGDCLYSRFLTFSTTTSFPLDFSKTLSATSFFQILSSSDFAITSCPSIFRCIWTSQNGVDLNFLISNSLSSKRLRVGL